MQSAWVVVTDFLTLESAVTVESSSSLCTFAFCITLGFLARVLYIGASTLSRRTDFLPVTVIIDFLFTATIGGTFIAYVVIFSVTIAPYQFVAMSIGYGVAFILTRKKRTHNHK